MKTRDHIFLLMIEKLHGSISEADNAYLSDLIESDPEVKEVWNNLQNRFSKEDIESGFGRIKADDFWPALSPMPPARDRVRRSRKVAYASAAAFAAILILFGGYYFYTATNKENSQQIASTGGLEPVRNQRAVQLKLKSGRLVNLSDPVDTTTLAGAVLNKGNRQLSYTTQGAIDGENILTVPIGLDYQITLSDGSQVWLNSATELRFPFTFSGNSREITLNGEAYLQVAKDTRKPFIVHTPHGYVRVLGTEFNVNTYQSGQVKVALVSGSVALKAAEHQVTIQPGEEATFELLKGITLSPFDKDEVLSWRDGVHFFQNATIKEMCDVFPRWFGYEIEMDNKAISGKRFSGVLDRKEPLINFLNGLKATTALDYYFDKDSVIHLR